MVRVKMALARTNHVCLCDFLFVFGSCLFSDPFFLAMRFGLTIQDFNVWCPTRVMGNTCI